MRLYLKHFDVLKKQIFKFFSALSYLLIRTYQLFLSPIFGGRCRFYPTCSEYCLECFSKIPFEKAFVLSLRRVLSCHPLGGQGFDPAPAAIEKR